jgi:murein L,D-transpeptidase YafK
LAAALRQGALLLSLSALSATAGAVSDAGSTVSRLVLPEMTGSHDPPATLLGRRDAIGGPDAKLRVAVRAWQRGDWRSALERLEDLVAKHPDFGAAHFMRAEILAARGGSRQAFARSLGVDYEHLAEEARLRIAPVAHEAGELPSALLRLPEGVDHAIAVDLSAARLYVISRQGDSLRVTRDHYAAMGSAGFGKEREGDNRTPLGVYRIQRWLDGEQLPELYGSGAFPVNYPNDWDRALGRTGHGIWLHGVPRDAYARPPRSSEGCVTLANADLQALGDIVSLQRTPVLLAERLRWQTPAQLRERRERFEAELEAWRQAWQQRDTETYLGFYAEDFEDDRGRDHAEFAAHKQAVNRGKRWISVEMRGLAIYDYPGEENLRLVSFEQRYASDNYASISQKRQFWRRQADGSWRIERVFEHDERPMPPEALRTAQAAMRED